METELIFEGDLGSVFTTAEGGEGDAHSTEIIVEGVEEATDDIETETIIDEDPETIIDGGQETIIEGEPETIIDGEHHTMLDGEAETIIDGEPDPDTEAAVAGIPVTMNVSLGDEGIEQELMDTNVVDEGMIEHIPIITPIPIADRPDTEISMEDELKSTERLDRSSPDLWPQNLPSAAHHILAKHASKTGEPEANLGIWAQGLDPEDINLLHQFGSLTSSSLVEEVKKLQNIAYQLGLEESKEMTRGKLLHVLDEDELTSKKEKESHVQRLWK